MSPVPSSNGWTRGKVVEKPVDPTELVLEAWAQGLLVGSLVILSFITLANMRRGVLLHKLILLELILGLWQGFWLFFRSPIYAWWLSVAAILLNASWSLHNVIAWMKIKPFLTKPASYFFIGTVILAQPYWVLEIYANFAYFHGVNKLFLKTRPWEALCRDPWWIFTTIFLFWVIKTQYEITLKEIIRISPRFGIMLLAMVLSIVFIVLDILTVTGALKLPGPIGINPFWKFAFVFKCLTDAVVLDDFKMALDRLRAFKISRLGSFSGDMSDSRSRNNGNLVATWEEMEREANTLQQARSPDGDYIHTSNFPFKPRKARRAHKDSVISPDNGYIRDSNAGLDPEDIVSSALEEQPMRMKEYAPVQKKHQRHFFDNPDAQESDDMIAESDYAEALREVTRDSGSTNRRPSGSPRQPGVG
ncbi:hypothetical protein FB567DRAFT_590286 [Paraphoma chrysanthemicola]|uniref:Uncharacterized protein n=1 Tax=Paraphoma chrysanthemicola TaxID=798071 RepID=A0A8K0R8M2_9PLEO|nr:hypothetical protein FB567DRAFT_590286 [Paraphoma chrysanthemicola]